MINNLINDIEQAMLGVLNNEQMSQLRKVLEYTFRNTSVSMKSSEVSNENDNKELVGSFLSAKRVEGCSGKSIHYYRSTLNNAIQNIGKMFAISELMIYVIICIIISKLVVLQRLQ